MNQSNNRMIGGRRSKAKDVSHLSNDTNLLVSIITVVFNGGQHIETTIKSVINQSYDNIEYIIFDGGSSDQTISILQRYDDIIDYWVSEPDEGIYDAMNKGIHASKGQWILFLGSDDCLFDSNVIRDLMVYATEDISLIFGNVIFDDGYHFRSVLNYRVLLNNTVHHQASLYNAKLFKSFLYDKTCMIYGDYELNLLIYLNKLKSIYIDRNFSFCGSNGASTFNRSVSADEINYIRKKYIHYSVQFLMKQILYIINSLVALKRLFSRVAK